MNIAHDEKYRAVVRDVLIEELNKNPGEPILTFADRCALASLRAVQQVMDGSNLVQFEGVDADTVQCLVDFLKEWRAAGRDEAKVSVVPTNFTLSMLPTNFTLADLQAIELAECLRRLAQPQTPTLIQEPTPGRLSKSQLGNMSKRFFERATHMKHHGSDVVAMDYAHFANLCDHLASLI